MRSKIILGGLLASISLSELHAMNRTPEQYQALKQQFGNFFRQHSKTVQNTTEASGKNNFTDILKAFPVGSNARNTLETNRTAPDLIALRDTYQPGDLTWTTLNDLLNADTLQDVVGSLPKKSNAWYVCRGLEVGLSVANNYGSGSFNIQNGLGNGLWPIFRDDTTAANWLNTTMVVALGNAGIIALATPQAAGYGADDDDPANWEAYYQAAIVTVAPVPAFEDGYLRFAKTLTTYLNVGGPGPNAVLPWAKKFFLDFYDALTDALAAIP